MCFACLWSTSLPSCFTFPTFKLFLWEEVIISWSKVRKGSTAAGKSGRDCFLNILELNLKVFSFILSRSFLSWLQNSYLDFRRFRLLRAIVEASFESIISWKLLPKWCQGMRLLQKICYGIDARAWGFCRKFAMELSRWIKEPQDCS